MVSVALDLLLLKHSKRKQLLLPIADGQSKAKQSKAKQREGASARAGCIAPFPAAPAAAPAIASLVRRASGPRHPRECRPCRWRRPPSPPCPISDIPPPHKTQKQNLIVLFTVWSTFAALFLFWSRASRFSRIRVGQIRWQTGRCSVTRRCCCSCCIPFKAGERGMPMTNEIKND